MYPNLKLELWQQGIRQNRFAKMLGMDETLLSRIVNGFREPDAITRERIARMLGRSEHWLFQPSEPAGPGSASSPRRAPEAESEDSSL